MLGAIIGDIVGSRFEWHNIKKKDFKLFTIDCFPTDDSIMTLAVARALWECIGDYTNLSEQTIETMRTIGRRYPNCGYGGGFRKWLNSRNPRPYNSCGNGSAMRVSPCAYAASSLEEAIELSRKVTEITHNHPEGIKGAEATTVAVYMARTGSSIQEIREYIHENYYPMDFTLDEIRPTYRFESTCQGTVPPAIMAFLESTDFEDAIRNAISIGGDSDTVAAITGSIAGAYYGVPTNIREQALFYMDRSLRRMLREFEEAFHLAPDESRLMSLPIPECFKEHYKQNDLSFSDSECATIIWNSMMTRAEKTAALAEIRDTTSNEPLKEQIQQRFERDAEIEVVFPLARESTVFVVELDDEDGGKLFETYDAALAFGMENCADEFTVIRAHRSGDELLIERQVIVSKDGTWLHCGESAEEGIARLTEPSGFENAYFQISSPFRYGDIVRLVDENMLAVIGALPEALNDPRCKNVYEDHQVAVSVLCSDGEFEDQMVHIFSLDKAEFWDDEDELELMLSVQRLMRGKGTVVDFLNRYNENCARRQS